MAKLTSRSRLLIAVPVLVFGCFLASTPLTAADVSNPVLVGRVIKVIDGDGLTVELLSGPLTVRLHSVDAPERDQPYGREAFAALYARTFGKTVELEVVEQDRYARQVAVVHVGAVNVNASLVQEGHAWAYRDYLDHHDYCRWEGEARMGKRGLWALPTSEQVAPWEWRDFTRGEVYVPTDYSQRFVEDCIKASSARGAQPAPAPGAAAEGNCQIKGNISDNGKIYHVPGSRSYNATRIDTSRGERWFCTEDEARAAGWRPHTG